MGKYFLALSFSSSMICFTWAEAWSIISSLPGFTAERIKKRTTAARKIRAAAFDERRQCFKSTILFKTFIPHTTLL